MPQPAVGGGPRSVPCRSSIQCIVPPYMLDRLTHSADAKVRDRAIAGLSRSAAVRAVRAFAQEIPGMMAVPSPAASKNRLIYDAKGRDTLPGKLCMTLRCQQDFDTENFCNMLHHTFFI